MMTEDELAQFPVSDSHHGFVIQWLLNIWRNNDKAVPDTMIQTKAESVSSEPEFIYKTFQRSESVFVTLLEENKDLISHGTTGLTSWQGALFLTDWSEIHTQHFKGKRILELGSGVGMLGISLLKSIDMKEYTFTDSHFQVLNFLSYNLQINFSQGRAAKDQLREAMFAGPPGVFSPDRISGVHYEQTVVQSSAAAEETRSVCEVRVQQLDWANFDVDRQLRKVDLILGSDIVYERSIFAPLCHVLRSLLQVSDAPCPEALIACTERKRATIELFELELKQHGLVFEVIHRGMYSPASNVLCSDVSHHIIKLYRITWEASHSNPNS